LLSDRLTHRDRIALETYRDSRAALALIRDAVEECAPPGLVRPETSGLAYLVSVGLVGVLILAVFFGTGFFLLAQNTEQIVGGSGTRDRGTEVVVPIRAELPPSAATAPLPVAPLAQGLTAREAPMPENSDPAGEAPVSAASGVLLSRAAPALTSTAREATLTPPATVSPVELKSSFTGATTPATPPARARPAAAKVAELLALGDSFIVVGDIASARVFYERAADAGDRRAALRMGATFDPAFLSRAQLRSTLGDLAQARSWYRRGLDLGGARAERRQNGADMR
jgi:TPR repeat protein